MLATRPSPLLLFFRAEEYNDVGDMIRKGAATLVRPQLDPLHVDVVGNESEWERSLTTRLRRRIGVCVCSCACVRACVCTALAIQNKEMRASV